jgi:4-amino-4-deoxy-L-arabinose transferase-like glycosyltransferase
MDGPGGGQVAPRRWPIRHHWIPYSDNGVALAAAFVTVAAFAIYLRTMMPSTGFWDTAEAQTVPVTLSIFHPTGFPLYALVGWAWSHLPLGDSVAWRMNLLSGVCVALAAGLVVLITGHLVLERDRRLRAVAAGIGGASFAFAAEPWENAGRADIHAVNVFFVALIVWLLLAWAAAERVRSPRSGRWLLAAALAFGLGIAAHPLVGLTAFGIAAWLLLVDRHLWRRWRLVAACAGMIAIGIGLYGYIWIRAVTAPEPPLFYAHPNTWENFRYLVFAEQFTHLFEDFESPLAQLASKWTDAERVLGAQFTVVGWLLAALGASVLAVRRWPALALLGLIAVANVFYAMNFRDGDIDRYYLPTIVITAPLIGVAVAAIADTVASAIADASARLVATRASQRRAATIAGALVLALGVLLPAVALAGGYRAQDRSHNREADAWVASVYAQLPPNSVVISWWSYSTPLWYHRWVLGERPDVTIIDERNILDDGYRTMRNAIRTFYGERPVFVVPPDWDYRRITDVWETRTVSTYPGYIDLLSIEGLRQ